MASFVVRPLRAAAPSLLLPCKIYGVASTTLPVAGGVRAVRYWGAVVAPVSKAGAGAGAGGVVKLRCCVNKPGAQDPPEAVYVCIVEQVESILHLMSLPVLSPPPQGVERADALRGGLLDLAAAAKEHSVDKLAGAEQLIGFAYDLVELADVCYPGVYLPPPAGKDDLVKFYLNLAEHWPYTLHPFATADVDETDKKLICAVKFAVEMARGTVWSSWAEWEYRSGGDEA